MVVGPFARRVERSAAQPAAAAVHRRRRFYGRWMGAALSADGGRSTDGTHYMVERFNNVLFTPESYGHMAAGWFGVRANIAGAGDGVVAKLRRDACTAGSDAGAEAVVHDPACRTRTGRWMGCLLPNDSSRWLR